MLRHPLTEALLGDLVVFTGMDRLRALLSKKKNENDGTTAAQPKKEPAKLPAIFVSLSKDERTKLAKWLPTISHYHRVKIEEMDKESLQKLLAFPEEDERIEALAMFEESPAEAIKRVTERFKNIEPIMPKTSKLIEEFGDWGKSPDPPENPRITAIKLVIETKLRCMFGFVSGFIKRNL